MKKTVFCTLMLSLIATLFSCQQNGDEIPIPTDSTTSVLGLWKLDSTVQQVYFNGRLVRTETYQDTGNTIQFNKDSTFRVVERGELESSGYYYHAQRQKKIYFVNALHPDSITNRSVGNIEFLIRNSLTFNIHTPRPDSPYIKEVAHFYYTK